MRRVLAMQTALSLLWEVRNTDVEKLFTKTQFFDTTSFCAQKEYVATFNNRFLLFSGVFGTWNIIFSR
jgi:hypothetical protein